MSVSSSLSWSLRAAYPQNGGVGVVSGWDAWSNPTRRSLTCSQMRHLCGAVNNWQFSLICSSLTTPHFSHSAYEIWGGKNPTTSAFLFTVHQSCFPCFSSHFLWFRGVNFLKHAELEPEHENSFWLYFVQSCFLGVFVVINTNFI